MKVAFFDAKPYDKIGFDRYTEGTDITIKYFETHLNEDTVSLAKGFDCVCVFVNDIVNKAVVDKLYEQGVKMIALRCAGFNNVDTRACFGKIHVFRVPAYSPYAVAEHAMALLLSLNRHIPRAYTRTRDFNFTLSGLTGFDLHGKTVGVIGTGRIGRVFIDICRGFGMKILAYDKYPAEGLGTGKIGKIFSDICKGFGMQVLAYDKFPNENLGLHYVDLPELLAKSDVISLHCPLTEDTHHMISEESIGHMKPGAIIINTSRGGLIDTEALINGMKQGRVYGAGLDVYEEEGDLFYEDFSGHVIQDDTLIRLIAMPNVIVTSHQAYLTREALDNIAHTTVSNIQTFFASELNPETEVCYHCARKEACRKERHKKCF